MTMPGSAASRAVNDLSSLLEVIRNPDKAKEVLDSLQAAAAKHDAAAAEARALTSKLSDLGAKHNEREEALAAKEAELARKVSDQETHAREANEAIRNTAMEQNQKAALLKAKENDLAAQTDALTSQQKNHRAAVAQWEKQAISEQQELADVRAKLNTRMVELAEREKRLRERQDRIAKAAQEA
jgi:hypothetical protein